MIRLSDSLLCRLNVYGPSLEVAGLVLGGEGRGSQSPIVHCTVLYCIALVVSTSSCLAQPHLDFIFFVCSGEKNTTA
jgi:hypothetical protein